MKAPGKKGRTSVWRLLIVEIGVLALLIGAITMARNGENAAQLAPPAKIVSAAPAPAVPVALKENPGITEFHQNILPILKANCYECHGDGKSEAGIAFDKLTTEDQILKNPDLWLKVLKNTRAGIMPADNNPRLSIADQATLDNWIKFAAFGVDPKDLDPGRVTAHRLNRFEYRNTIRDLLGVDFDTDSAFPGDDIGYGFDNIADVLNTSPLLMEKYLAAAQTVVSQAVPTTSRVAPKVVALGRDFLDATTGRTPSLDASTIENGIVPRTAAKTSYFTEAHFIHTFHITTEGDYKLKVEQGVGSNFTYVAANTTITISVDGKQMTQKVFEWHGANSNVEKQPSTYDTISVHWTPGDHEVLVSAVPLSGVMDSGKHDVAFLLRSATVEGPADPTHWIHPANYQYFFTREDAPTDPVERRAYARELLKGFASRAFRRPPPDETLDKLVAIAEKEYSQPDKTFEMGISQAMVAVLASPRFLFRIDVPETTPGKPATFAQVDEYSLASRLSYFLWSTMPDDELLKLAATGQLRKNLAAQVQRMVADPRSNAFINNFSDQWLQSRAVKTVAINSTEILKRENQPAYDLTADDRRLLNEEAQAYFGYVMRNDRSINEFIESNYMFLNSGLANYYYYYSPDYAANFTGNEMRKVDLPPGDWRGGVLTLGSVMMVTSNPTRTSPVKRGKWILENILDAPAPPPPANIPALDEAAKDLDHVPTQREILAKHRADPNCASCHDRMDPLGLALENFSAIGTVRLIDMQQPIDATGHLITGEAITDIRDLKHTLITNHRDEFYRCLTGKLLTYALGRGTDYYDVATVDKIVENLDENDGHFSVLLQGIIDSAAFQEERTVPNSPSPVANPAIRVSQNTPHP